MQCKNVIYLNFVFLVCGGWLIHRELTIWCVRNLGIALILLLGCVFFILR